MTKDKLLRVFILIVLKVTLGMSRSYFNQGIKARRLEAPGTRRAFKNFFLKMVLMNLWRRK